MSEIHIFIPKKHMNDCNKDDWWINKHKKPFAFTSEVNKAIRDKTSDIDKFIADLLFKECYTNRYMMKTELKRVNVE